MGATVASLSLGATVTAQEQETRVPLVLSEAGCDPNVMEVPSGLVVFEVFNDGSEFAEFEIILDDEVIDEVYLQPGFQANFATRLDGGDYETTCYLRSAPRGTLTVTGGPAPTAPPSVVVPSDVLADYQAAYQRYVSERAGELVARTDLLVRALKGDALDRARELYATSRVPWEEIEPIAELFVDLDVAIDSREEDHAEGVDDPGFTGYHRIERILWVDGASGDLDALADELQADVIDLQGRLASQPISPRLMARGAGELVDEIAQSKLTGEEDRYSGTDLWSIDANLIGSRYIVDLVRPSLETIDPDYLARVDGGFAAVDEVMARLKTDDGWVLFSEIAPEDLRELQTSMAGLAEVLALLPGTLGLQA